MSNMIEYAKEQVRQAVLSAMGKLAVENPPAFIVEIPADPANGDFSCNAAMVCAKALKKNPREIAAAIIENIDSQGIFERVETAGPGFINFYLAANWYSQAVSGIIAAGADFGKSDFGAGKRVLIEFFSANPTGPLH
ncbi:MAG: arginine--tRNA ligase, partial [Oscillospiraceae bacterium]|nr:arginine--tRNA ligase [Oscillospiraceae bacterium]